jgi:hypothetical protein
LSRISEQDKAYLLSLKPEDITYELGMELFADHVKKVDGKVIEVKSRFEPHDHFLLRAGEYINKETIITTVGSFIFNKFIIEPRFAEFLGYNNEVINSDGLKDLENKLSKLLLEDKITTTDFGDYFNRIQWLGMQFHEPLAASFTMRGLKPIPKVIKRREELIKQNKEALEKGDVMVMSAIEKELVELAKSEVSDDPSMDLYYSGARGSIPNNYKQLSIVKGPVFNKTIGKYQFIQNSFFEGLRKEDIAAAGTNVINGQYPKSCGTAVSGYKAKQVSSLGQAVILRKDVNDCGTKGYVEIVLSPSLKSKFLYRYIIDGGKLVLLDDETLNKYVGKKIKLRSIMYCGCDSGVCMTCAGKLFEKLQIDSIGLTTSTLTGALLNLKMKSFHDTSVKINEINLDDITF